MQGAIKLFGGQWLANLAHRIDQGEFGERLQRWYRSTKGRKRVIAFGLYGLGFALAALATQVGGCAPPEAIVAGSACALILGASKVLAWISWLSWRVGITDNSARVKPAGLPAELAAAASDEAILLAVIIGTGLVGRYFGIPAEIMDTFTQHILVATFVHVGLLGSSAATRLALPEPRPIIGRGPR